MSQLSWPERFAVELRPVTGDPVTYKVLTWLHDRKAIVLAVEAHRRRWPDCHVYDVSVVSLGKAPEDGRGLAEVGDDLFDRYEF